MPTELPYDGILTDKCYKNVSLSRPVHSKKLDDENWVQEFGLVLENFFDEHFNTFNSACYRFKTRHMSKQARKKLYWIASVFESLPKCHQQRVADALQDDIHLPEKDWIHNLNDALNIIKTPQSIDQALKKYRRDLVLSLANFYDYQKKDERQAWLHFASQQGFGVGGNLSAGSQPLDEKYTMPLKNYFALEYDFFAIFFTITAQIESTLKRYGYRGINIRGGGYSVYQAKKFTEYLNCILKTSGVDYYLCRDEGEIVGIHWPSVYHQLLVRLVDGHYLNLPKDILNTLKALFPSPKYPMKFPPNLVNLHQLLDFQSHVHQLVILHHLFDYIPDGVYESRLNFFKAVLPTRQFEDIFYRYGKENFIEAMRQENDEIFFFFVETWSVRLDYFWDIFLGNKQDVIQNLLFDLIFDHRKYFTELLKFCRDKPAFLEPLLDLVLFEKNGAKMQLMPLLAHENGIDEIALLIELCMPFPSLMEKLYSQLFSSGRFSPMALLIKPPYDAAFRTLLDWVVSTPKAVHRIFHEKINYHYKSLSIIATALKLGNVPLAIVLLQCASEQNPQWIVPMLRETEGYHGLNVLLCGCLRAKGASEQLQFLRFLFSERLNVPSEVLHEACTPENGLLVVFQLAPSQLAILFQVVWEQKEHTLFRSMIAQVGGKSCEKFKEKNIKKALKKAYYAAERIVTTIDVFYQLEHFHFFIEQCDPKRDSNFVHLQSLYDDLSHAWLKFCRSSQAISDLNQLYDLCCVRIEKNLHSEASVMQHKTLTVIMRCFLEDIRELGAYHYNTSVRFFNSNRNYSPLSDFPRLDRGIHESLDIAGSRGQAAGSRERLEG